MTNLKPIIVEHNKNTHVEIVDEHGFTGHDPTADDILEAYIAEFGHAPQTQDEIRSFGNLALRTADYHSELFETAKVDIDLFGIEEPDLREVSSALSLDRLHARQVYPYLSKIRTSRVDNDTDQNVG